MTNPRKILILTVVILMACMTTVEPYATYPADTPSAGTATNNDASASPNSAILQDEPDSGAVFEPDTLAPLAGWNMTLETRCAQVTAAEALHIRTGPSEKATVIGYLHNGDVVSLIDSRHSWWKIATMTAQGWSKAEFLKESECE